MKTFLLRHGEADWPNWNKPDDDRPLNEKGRKEMKKVAEFLALLDQQPTLILTSPLPRASQTAEIAADRLGVKLKEEKKIRPGFDAAKMLSLVEAHPDETLMFVGHNPDFAEIVQEITGGEVKFAKAGVALLKIEGKTGELLWLIPPSVAKAATEK